jgi:zinc protease
MRNLAVLLAVALPLAAVEQTHTLSNWSLANGMKVIVQEDHDIPNVALYLFYRIGSRNEGPGTTGISHFFEHMMFNGAKKYGSKQFDIVMEKHGGANNAYTTRDVTVYSDWFPKAALPLIFDMEADRIQNLAFDPKMVESERGVVYSERQLRVDNDNFGSLYEQLNAAAFTAHPYGWPVIGWASDIQSWSLEDLKQHYRIGYAPNNAVLVVVGDVTAAEIKALADKHLAPIPRQEPPPRVRTVEPPQKGERRIEVRKPAQLPLQLVAYHIPETADKDTPALEVLGALLTKGRSSRLYRRMVDGDQVALEVGQFMGESLDPGLMIFYAQPRDGVEPPRSEAILFEEIENMRQAGVEPAELEKAKNQLLTDLYRDLKTISGRADQLGKYEIFHGDHQKLFTAGDRISAVTAEDVQRVAKQYLGAANRTVATLIPESKSEKQDK